MKKDTKGTAIDPYGIQNSKNKLADRDQRIKAVEEALLEAVEEFKMIRNKIEKIETALKNDSNNL